MDTQQNSNNVSEYAKKFTKGTSVKQYDKKGEVVRGWDGQEDDYEPLQKWKERNKETINQYPNGPNDSNKYIIVGWKNKHGFIYDYELYPLNMLSENNYPKLDTFGSNFSDAATMAKNTLSIPFKPFKTGGKKTKRHRNKSRRKTIRKKTIKKKSNKKRSKK